MPDLEFEDYEADSPDGGKTQVSAAEVTEPTEVNTLTGSHIASPGDYVVATDRPGVYDIVTGDAWSESAYGGGENNFDNTPDNDISNESNRTQTPGEDSSSLDHSQDSADTRFNDDATGSEESDSPARSGDDNAEGSSESPKAWS